MALAAVLSSSSATPGNRVKCDPSCSSGHSSTVGCNPAAGPQNLAAWSGLSRRGRRAQRATDRDRAEDQRRATRAAPLPGAMISACRVHRIVALGAIKPQHRPLANEPVDDQIIPMFLSQWSVLMLVLATSLAGQTPQAPRSVRLYVFDCGTLHPPDVSRFRLTPQEVATTKMAVACYLIVHPKGTLIWDTGAVPDGAWTPTGDTSTQHLVLPDSAKREVVMVKSLSAQLAELGYSPSGITYLALSHCHYDHTANANSFAGATWLVRQNERVAMFAQKPLPLTQPSTYSALSTSKTVIIDSDAYDVFGDGTVVIKTAPGHTSGHQILYLRLAKTGGVVLSGDLYHFPEQRTLGRVPTFEFDQDETRASRVEVEAFLKATGAQLWIQHDFIGNAKLKKSPEFYE